MNLVKWDPFRHFPVWEPLGGNMGRLWGENGKELASAATWAPAVDIFEDDKAITIKVELPEVGKEDIKIEVDGDMLSIRGQRRLEKEDKKENYHRIERSYGSFSRSFHIPEAVNHDKIEAENRDGVLRVTLPKSRAEAPKPKAVTIK